MTDRNFEGLQIWQSGDREGAIAFFRQLAAEGDSYAMGTLGRLLEVMGQFDEAKVFYMRAAELGEPKAQFNLSLVYEKEGDLATSEAWLLKAAEGGLPLANRKLAALKEQSGDFPRALELFRIAAETGIEQDWFDFAGFLFRSDLFDEGDFWLKKAAEAGHADAQYFLGTILEEEDAQAAMQWFKRAADQGHVEALKRCSN